MNDRDPVGPEKDSKPLSKPAATVLDAEIASIIEKAQAEGLQLTGEGGLLPGMIKQAVEAAMNVELTDHLGYERYAVEGRGSGNSRNGTTPFDSADQRRAGRSGSSS